MRYPASEKLEIIRLVENAHLSARRTLQKLGIPRATFNRWYDRFLAGGVDALEDRRPRPNRVWNRIPEETRDQIIDLALNEPELSPRELAVTFTDTKGYFVSESSVYRLLKAHDLITSPAFIVIKAADEFHDKTTAPNQLWQTDFTYLKVIGWGWFYLSTVLDDFSRYIIAWKLCTTMKAGDVTDTLTMALRASGCDSARVMQRPRLLSDNGPSYVSSELAEWLSDKAWTTPAALPAIPRPRARSSAGTRRSRTGSCSKTTSCPVISSGRSPPSSIITTTADTTRASAISLPPTSTSGAATSSCWKGKGSNAKPSHSDACFTGKRPPKMITLWTRASVSSRRLLSQNP